MCPAINTENMYSHTQLALVPAPRPARGRNLEDASHATLVNRVRDRNNLTLRLVSSLGDFEVWTEPRERRLFHLNLGIMRSIHAEAAKTRQQFRSNLKELRDLTSEEETNFVRQALDNPENRHFANLRLTPADLGGWLRCLDMATDFLVAQGLNPPWQWPFQRVNVSARE